MRDSRTGAHRRSIWNLSLIVFGLLLCLLAISSNFVLRLEDPTLQRLESALVPPVFQGGGTFAHPLGTDHLGRDYFARLIAGTRLTVLVALSAALLGAVGGSLLGILAGFKGGLVDSVISRITEAQLSLPFILLAISVIVARGKSVSSLILVLALVGWAQYVRVLRAETLALRESGFITSLRLSGLSDLRIILRHVVPNVLGTVLTLATLEIGTLVLAESALSFLGLGIVEPDISWGSELASGKNYMESAWWLVTFPGIAISVCVLYVNLAGDALRVYFDRRKRMY